MCMCISFRKKKPRSTPHGKGEGVTKQMRLTDVCFSCSLDFLVETFQWLSVCLMGPSEISNHFTDDLVNKY
jgi:hypothetical protein